MCENRYESVTQFWTNPSEEDNEDEERKHFDRLATFRFGTFVMFFMPLGVLLVMKTLENEWFKGL